MSTITKEWLQQKIADMEATRDEIPFGLDEDDSNTLAALRIALASLEAEAVGFIARHKETGKFGSYLHPKADWFKNDDYEVLSAYTAPPAPVSVHEDEHCKPHPVMAVKGELGFLDHFDRIISERDEDIDIGQLGSGNYEALMLAALDAFRAAMFQGADGNSPVNQDGWVMVPAEPTPEMREAYHQAQAEYEDVDGLWSPDHQWQAMLAAAPQQEVK